MLLVRRGLSAYPLSFKSPCFKSNIHIGISNLNSDCSTFGKKNFFLGKKTEYINVFTLACNVFHRFISNLQFSLPPINYLMKFKTSLQTFFPLKIHLTKYGQSRTSKSLFPLCQFDIEFLFLFMFDFK